MPTSKKDHISVINRLIRFTSLSSSSDLSSIFSATPIDTPQEHVKFQNNLMSSFDWNFCEQLIKYFECSFVIINAHDNTTICYKSKYLIEKKYVVIKYTSRYDLTLYYKSF